MDFEYLFKMSWKHYINGIVSLILFVLVGFLLCITIVLIPTVVGGWMRGTLAYVREHKKPKLQELWNFEDYFQTLILLVFGGLLMAIGYMLLIIPGLVLNVFWLYSLLFVVDKKMVFTDAMIASKEAVTKGGFFQHLVILLIVLFLNSVSSAMGGVGSILTTPFSLVLVTIAYLDVVESRRLVDNATP